MDQILNTLSWFEIPALDLYRAKKFYETIFNIRMNILPEIFGIKMASFPSGINHDKIPGALCESELHMPCMDGTLIYLNSNPFIQEILDRIEPAGGQILMPKILISPQSGYIALFIDTEGNRIGLHADQ